MTFSSLVRSLCETDMSRLVVVLWLICGLLPGVSAPPMGDRLVVAVGLIGSEDPADSTF